MTSNNPNIEENPFPRISISPHFLVIPITLSPGVDFRIRDRLYQGRGGQNSGIPDTLVMPEILPSHDKMESDKDVLERNTPICKSSYCRTNTFVCAKKIKYLGTEANTRKYTVTYKCNQCGRKEKGPSELWY